MRKQTAFITIAITLCLIFLLIAPNHQENPDPGHASPTPMSIQPVADALVFQAYPTTNYGSFTTLQTDPLSGRVIRFFIRFDLSSIPGGANIVSAKIKLQYVQYYFNNPSGRTIECRHCTDDGWSEGTIIWNNAPFGQCAGSATATATVPSSAACKMEWDVTSDVQSDYTGDKKSSWMLKDSAEGTATRIIPGWASKEFSAPDSRPILEVEYTTADFSISVSPTSLTITRGASGTSTVTVTSTVGGFNSPVSLSCSNLPSGVTSSFSPSSVTPSAGGSATSTLTLTVSSSASLGSSDINVVGTSGSLTHSTPIHLTIISGPDFTITASPNALTLAPGSSGVSSITVTSVGGFSTAVSLSISGLPTGATESFSPASVTPPADDSTQSTLTISTTPGVTSGIYTLTVTGTSGATTHSTTITLTIPSPATYSFNVRTGATKIIVTCTWSGSGSTSIQLVSPTTTYTESSMSVYEKTTISVSGGTTTYNHLKRVELTLTAPASSDQIWTLRLYTDVTMYQLNIETA